MRATWMVQATVNEPFAMIVAFVAHYLDLGADLVHLHLDVPHPGVQAAFARHPKVRLTLCDEAYWRKLRPKRGRPLGHPERQINNARHTFQRLEQDWLLLCDADEFVVPDSDLGTLLASQPVYPDFLRMSVAEKVIPPGMQPRTIFEGVFRLPQTRGMDLAEEIYGPELAPLLDRIVAGHDLGKYFIRRGGDFEVRHHTPTAHKVSPERPHPKEPVGIWLPGVVLAHYDALTPLHYLIKLLIKTLANKTITEAGRQPGSRHVSREAQMELATAACRTPDPIAVTRVLHDLTPQSYAALERHGLLRDLHLHPDETARRLFPDLALDYSPDAFNLDLRRKHAAVLKAMHLKGDAAPLNSGGLGSGLVSWLKTEGSGPLGSLARKLTGSKG